MDWAEEQTAVNVAIAVFRASSRFKLEGTFQKYGKFLAGVLPSLERCAGFMGGRLALYSMCAYAVIHALSMRILYALELS